MYRGTFSGREEGVRKRAFCGGEAVFEAGLFLVSCLVSVLGVEGSFEVCTGCLAD